MGRSRRPLCGAAHPAPPGAGAARHGTARLALPEPYRQRLRTTNGVVRLNEEIRRGERVIRIFPSRESALRLLGTLLMEQDEQWSTGKRYFDMTAYWQWRGREAQAAQHAPEGGSPPTT